MAKRLVIGANRFNFTSPDGKHISGANLTILEPRPVDIDGNRVGFQTLQLPTNLEAYLVISRQSLPAWFETVEGVRGNAKGRAELTVDSVSYSESCDLGI